MLRIEAYLRRLHGKALNVSAGGRPPESLAESVRSALQWLCVTQDVTNEGGFARAYSLPTGWGLPYPETTGYIIPTFLEQYTRFPELQLRSRAARAGNWLAEVQFESGAICSKQYQPGKTTPSVFNTGMVLHGWVSLLECQTDERIRAAALRAVDWLIQQQEPDGSWVKAAFNGIPHTYYTMVDWALVRYSRLAGDGRAREVARKNLDWALRQQRSNGWFDHCWFGVGDAVTTHTLSYTTQGLVESALLLDRVGGPQSLKAESRKQKAEIQYSHGPADAIQVNSEGMKLVEAAVRATEPLRRYFEQHDMLPGTLDENWHPTARWECCTGSAQTSLVWQALGRLTGDKKWGVAAKKLNQRLLKYQRVNCRVPGINGAIPGSWPINGGYDSLAFPNHAAKFHVDALSGQS